MLEMPDNFTPTEQAIFYVTQYPCLHCLWPKCSTPDQRDYFFNLQRIQAYTALVWLARLAGRDDPLYPLLQRKAISQDFYSWVYLKVSYLEDLWSLCQLLAPRMVETFRKLGREDLIEGTNALFLFKAAVMEKTNWQIQASFGYVEVSGRKSDTGLKLIVKAIKEGLTPKEVKRLQKFAPRDVEYSSLNLLASVALQNFKDSAVKAQFEVFMLAMARLCEKEATISRKGGCWGWNNGVKLTGSKSSVYCPVLSAP